MSRKIIGVTVGSSLPKPNFNQTDPTKGDYIRNKPDFEGLKDQVNTVSGLVGDTEVSKQISDAIAAIEPTITEEEIPNLYIWEKLKSEHATSYEVVETDAANVRIGYKLSYKTEWDEVKYADSYELQGDKITLINPTAVNLDESNRSVVLGKYIYYNGSYYKIPSTSKLSSHSGTVYKEILVDNAKQLIVNSITDTQETKLGYVSSKSFNTYPTNGEHTDGYWYKYIKQMGDSAIVDGSSVNFTETDPTVPAWAKAATKPTYTASEVGALPDTTMIPSKTSDLTNDSGYITSAPVTSVNGMTGDITLSASDVSALPDTTVIPDALSDLADDSTHRTVTDTEKSTWNAKANKSDIPTVPTRVSAFENDKGYLTEHQSLEDYAKTSDIPTKTSELTNDSKFATETYVDNKFSDVNGILIDPTLSIEGQAADAKAVGDALANIEVSASIDVTAEVGKTIVVKTVDANGKPTEWEAVDYQPRTHWTYEDGTVRKLDNKYINAEWMATKETSGDSSLYIPEQTISSNIWNNLQIGLQSGFFYDVTINGEVYTCEARTDDGGVILGNNFSMNLNDYPFCISWAGDGATAGMFFKDSSLSYPITLKVAGHIETVYNKLPVEYLPEIATDEQIASAVHNYLQDNPIDVPDNVATQDDVDGIYDYVDECVEGLPTQEDIDNAVNGITFEQKQADYNQNNSNAADYIKNRTHYTEYKKEYLVENLEFTKTANMQSFTWITYLKVENLEKVYVVFDGVEYVCPVKVVIDIQNGLDESYFSIGNTFVNNSPEYPFGLFGYKGNNFTLVYAEEGEHTISVYYDGEEIVHKLDNKYINAEWMATKEVNGGNTVYIAEQTISGNIWSNLQADLQPGIIYDVIINDKVYICECSTADDGIILGNDTSMTLNDYPFCIFWLGSGATSGMFFNDDTLTYPITLKVTDHVETVYNKLPVEYLPEIEIPDSIYKNNEAPANPQEGDLWLDMDEEAAVSGGTVTDEQIASAVEDYFEEHPIDSFSAVEPAYEDRPKFFFGAPLQPTKDEIVTTFSYRSKTMSFDCYAEIKAQGNSTLGWPKKNQTIKLYKDAACTEKFKVDFKGWGKQNKFVIKANWRDLTHVRDIVSVRLEGDCMRSNPDFDELPELLKTSPNLGGIDGFPVVVYAAGVYQGRYMCNIPKDKWMTNMDDDLNEHCILCSEDYNSSCFRAAANINGNDWTDEIHDTVPASIKTRWNEVISFVRNSTDEEFVANLDSYIKVSTLIDRHLMGLLSCDYDGYGKNQLYITYDGQQWYADRYDKDGTWGNYWTGNSMLPSNYGREQYEDMISGRPGNLLFIRLEQLFWERLQTRWAELRDGVLSIPNIINRFRELYDITPPYVIDEDYASTTANGKFTGIPNKTTCTIQQIQQFVVERHAWMDEYIASLAPVEEVPCTGITLNSETLTFTAAGTQTLTATVTPEGCTDELTWESNNVSVATVNGGVVTAKANGNATITARCGDYSASCSVVVSGIAEPIPCTGITLNKSELEFAELGNQTITATVTPANTTDDVQWSTSNASVASVVGGVVTAIANGSATITAKCGAYSASCAVSVSGIESGGGEEDITPVYSLAETTTFNGTSDFVDTGVKLYDTEKDWTIILAADFTQCRNVSMNMMHCIYEVNPWPGVNIYLNINADDAASRKYEIGGNAGAGSGQAYLSNMPATATKLAIRCTGGKIDKVAYINEGKITSNTPNKVTYTAYDGNLLLGCYQDTSGNKGRFWNGTISQCDVYFAALSDSKIETLLN